MKFHSDNDTKYCVSINMTLSNTFCGLSLFTPTVQYGKVYYNNDSI